MVQPTLQQERKNKRSTKMFATYWQTFSKLVRLHTIFNRNNIKVSYSCMRNVKTSISNHNHQNNELNPPQIVIVDCQMNAPLTENASLRIWYIKQKSLQPTLKKQRYISEWHQAHSKSVMPTTRNHLTTLVTHLKPSSQNMCGNLRTRNAISPSNGPFWSVSPLVQQAEVNVTYVLKKNCVSWNRTVH